MQLELQCAIAHPFHSKAVTEYALSSTTCRLLTASRDLIADHNVATNAIRVILRTSSPVEKLVYVGAAKSFLVFLSSSEIVSYLDNPDAISLAANRSFDGGRVLSLAQGTPYGSYAAFVKADSPSLWCVRIESGGEIGKPFKLRSHVENNQGNKKVVDDVFARVRGKLATNVQTRICPITAIALHDEAPKVAALYDNGIIRVWDISKKHLQACFDLQLLMNEKPIDITIHPFRPVVSICTSLGRIMAFHMVNAPFKLDQKPILACSRVREGRKRFLAMCFTKSRPAHLMLLTTSQRVVYKLINSSNMIVASSRFPKASRIPLSTETLLKSRKYLEDVVAKRASGNFISLESEASLGLLLCTLDTTGSIWVFRTATAGLPMIQRPITSGLDTGFSHDKKSYCSGPVLVNSDSLVAHKGCLFRYELSAEQVSVCCQLPPGDLQRMEIARDGNGLCSAALVFYSGEEEQDVNSYSDPEPPGKYVLCTRHHGKLWNVGEPSGGISGCFLGPPNGQDKIFILDNSGSSAALFSFAIHTAQQPQAMQISRRVQHVKLGSNRVKQVFRTPFCNWNAVLYDDTDRNRLVVSRNAFLSTSGRDGNHDYSNDYSLDEDTSLPLGEGEVLVDVRWQQLPSKAEQYIAAIMTNRKIYFVRDVLRVMSTFDIHGISRKTVPLAIPYMSWVGPTVLFVQGSSVFSISVDGQAELIANLSHGGQVTAVVASLPDRLLYTTTTSDSLKCEITILSRPYSPLSTSLRGLLAFESQKSRQSADLVDKVKYILSTHDASQATDELISSLIRNDLMPIAYLIATSNEGKNSLSTLRRAALLGQMGELNGALSVIEEEYASLPDSGSFHDGTELFRATQLLLNISIAAGDFAVGRRCSALLGQRGTFSSFIDREGGYHALQSVLSVARAEGNNQLVMTLKPLVQKSSASSVATDSSVLVNAKAVREFQRAIQNLNPTAITIGSADKCQVIVKLPLEEEGAEGDSERRVLLTANLANDICDRLEVVKGEACHVYRDKEEIIDNEIDENIEYKTSEAVAYDADESIANAAILTDESGTARNDDGVAQQTSENGQNAADSSTMSADHGDLTHTSRTVTQETRKKILDRKEESKVAFREMKERAGQLVLSQRNLEPTGNPIADTRAAEIYDRATRKYANGRFSLAQKELDSALRSLARGRERGIGTPPEMLHGTVLYQMACRIQVAMEEIAHGEHANTIPGRVTYAQLANGLTRLPLLVPDRINALVKAVDANLLLGNYGTSAQALRFVKELGVPPDLRLSLRDKFAACQSRGFVDTMPQTGGNICFRSLKEIGSSQCSACPACPAVFSLQSGVVAGTICPCCSVGQILLR